MLSISFITLLTWVALGQRARIVTPHLWEREVEDLTSQTFREILPRRGELPSPQGVDRFHIFLMIYEDQCANDVENPFFKGIEYKTGPGVVYIASLNKNQVPSIESDWGLSSNCSHLLLIPRGSRYEDFGKFKIAEQQDARYMVNFLTEITRTDATFVNKAGRKLNMFWWDKDEKSNGELDPETQMTIGTFLGHMFLWRDAATKEVVNVHLVDDFDSVIEIREMDQCEREHITDPEECSQTKEKFLREEAYEFWAKQREALNFIQPKLFPNFTAMGFKKTKLPKSLHEQILNWYHAHEPDPSTSPQEYLAGPVLNQIDSPTFMAHLEGPERTALENHLRPLLEEWSGLSDLKLTSLYGIRKYTNGAYLGMHCDTCTTHVISAIINVDQHVREDWPLQIYDPLGNMHTVTMEAGDVVFYESATANHARQIPMNGTDYSNIFIHFRPTSRDRWDCDWF